MSSVTDVSDAAQGVSAALLAATGNPADAIRLLSELADFSPALVSTTDPIGAAIGDMNDATGDVLRRSALTSLARAATTYQPSSYNDAAAVRSAVVALLDGEITIAGDQGEDDVYEAFQALRVAVIQDLTTRGASLAPIITFTINAPLPALALATKIYRDPSRADQLVTQIDPIHPLFCQTVFQALAE